MQAHATQIDLDSGFFAISHELLGTEYFRLVRGGRSRPTGARPTSSRGCEMEGAAPQAVRAVHR